MNRRKSIVQSSDGGRSSEKKHRSPFSPFKRGDSSREAQIPESPASRDRSGAGTLNDISEGGHTMSRSRDGGTIEEVPSSPGSKPPTANGTDTHTGEPGFVTPNPNEVRDAISSIAHD